MYSTQLLFSSEIFREQFASLFTVMLRHGYNPGYMLETIISSIRKIAKESIQYSEN